ncbi:MAG: hypothetical protein IJ511_02560 [Bacteroides sp.]|nr:hypothetical protein [Bacteroides sp.]
MKRTASALVAWIMATAALTPAVAQETEKHQEQVTFERPDFVTLQTSGDTMTVSVQGKAGNPDFLYKRQVTLASDAPVVTKERQADWDFDLPFKNRKRHVRRPKNKVRLHAFGLGLVSALQAPQGMDTDLGASYEVMGPTLEWAYYPGNSPLNLSIGVGLNWKNYRMTGHTRFLKQDGQVTLGSYPEGADVKFSRLKVFSWTMPVMLNYDLSRDWDFSIGPVVNFNTHASLKTRYTLNGEKYKETEKELHQNRVTVDLMAHLSFRSIGFYAKYAPCKVLNTEWGPDFRALSFGMTLWW